MSTTIHLLARSFYQESITHFIDRRNIGIEILNKKTAFSQELNVPNTTHLCLIESHYLLEKYSINARTTPILFIGTLKQLYRLFEIPSQSNGGYITPADGFEMLSFAIDRLIQGKWFLSSSTKSFLESDRLQQQRTLLKKTIQKPLTRCELEILMDIGNGKTTSMIARKRFRSIHTVKTQRKQIRRKLNLADQYNLNILAAKKAREIQTLSAIIHSSKRTQFLLKNTT